MAEIGFLICHQNELLSDGSLRATDFHGKTICSNYGLEAPLQTPQLHFYKHLF